MLQYRYFNIILYTNWSTCVIYTWALRNAVVKVLDLKFWNNNVNTVSKEC